MSMIKGTLDSWTATVGTPHTIDAARTVDGMYSLVIDLKNVTLGDTVVLTISGKVDTAETAQVVDTRTWTHALAEPLVVINDLVCIGSLSATLNQTAGTGRAIKARWVNWAWPNRAAP